jgi:segregation and condensation protein B
MSSTDDWSDPDTPIGDDAIEPPEATDVGDVAAGDDAEVVGADVDGLVAEPVGVGDPDATDEAIAAIESAERVRDASKRAIEALVMVAEEPLASNLLGQLLEVSPVVVDRLCEELAAAYDGEGRGFQLVRVAGGWRYQSHPDQSVYVERFVLQGQTAKLSVAALETLAIVAYKQPVSRAQVASIRGVSVDGVMRTLEQRGYIAEIGKDPGPGQAVLFGTTPLFLEKLGLDNIDELPPLGDFVPGADVVEQLEQGLRPDRMPLRPEDAMLAGGAPVSVGDDVGDDDDADATGDDGFDRGGFGVESGFDLLAGMGEIAGISLDDDGGAPEAGSTNGHGHLPSDDGAPDVEAPDGIDLRDVRPTGRGDDDRPVDDE